MARWSSSNLFKEEELDLAEELKNEEIPKRTRKPRAKKVPVEIPEAVQEIPTTGEEAAALPKKRTRRTVAPKEETTAEPKPRRRRKPTVEGSESPEASAAPPVAKSEEAMQEEAAMPKPTPSPENPVAPISAPSTIVEPNASEGSSTAQAVAATAMASETVEPITEPGKVMTPPSPEPTVPSLVASQAATDTVVAMVPRTPANPRPRSSENEPAPTSAPAPSSSNFRPKENRRPDMPSRGPNNNRRDLPRQRENPLTIAQLDAMTLLELYKLARQLNIDNFRQYKKGELIWEILRARTHKDGFVFVQGLLDIVGDYGFLRPTDFQRSREDVYVSASQIRRFDLRAGDQVSGQARPPKDGERYFALLRVEAVNGMSPEKSAERPDFDGLTPIFPDSRFRLETSREDLACRLVDIVAPIGRGQRGLVVAPPKAGKTVLLKKLANAISQNSPETHLMVLLIDERPEEVTDMERSVRGEVASSTFDEPPEDHIRVAEMVLERAKRLVEMGRDVVILLDSITRLARAYNLTIPASGRTLSGGMDPAALHKPKRFFGAARKVENGGSLTILATALVDTGSRMDDVIYEEFKGTGNMELHLDRKLAERRTFPAVDIKRSGTRREDLLMTPEELDIIWQVRKAIHNLGNQEATELLLQNLKRTRANSEFFKLFMASQGSQG